ncbi:hypothetical protein E0Z10_g2595 [Xylaria hypoxylon]|uniref:EF-hand domain-containing protein n=1 Tax=Xylaria hypoxylon TaxID=37992 RepID=A0A4Z0YPE7_9PEZI|nr:hypothetical protein E0Z10_g2595 [Xylaria hypoxylon]
MSDPTGFVQLTPSMEDSNSQENRARGPLECVYQTQPPASANANANASSLGQAESKPPTHSVTSATSAGSTPEIVSRGHVHTPLNASPSDLTLVQSPHSSRFYPSPSSSHLTSHIDDAESDVDLPDGPWRRIWELRLLHNSQTRMKQSFAQMRQSFSQTTTPDDERTFSEDVPDMAISFAQKQGRCSLLYVELAHSALHMWTTSTDKQEREELIKLQQTYQLMCSKEQRRDVDEIPHASPKLLDYICFTALRIVAHSLALVQTLSLDPWEPPLQWLYMGHGAGSVFRKASDALEAGNHGMMSKFVNSPPIMRNAKDLILSDHSQLTWLLDHPSHPSSINAQTDQELNDEGVRSVYEKALAYTCSVLRAIDREESQVAIARRLGGFAVWVPIEFSKFIEQRRPRALVILAHFMSIWVDYDDIWLLGRAGEWQIRCIHKNLPMGGIIAWHEESQEPPKRKAAKDALPKERQSKLAKEHNISAREEREIKEAFALFAEPMDGEKEGVIPTKDVRRAMVNHHSALGLPPSKPELKEFLSIMDPDDDGHATYEPFLAICALKLHARDEGDGPDSAEVEEAFRLFTGAGSSAGGSGAGGFVGGDADLLTLAHLKRIAMTLKQDVDEALLRDMILEANGGAGVGRGVSMSEFEEVMRRAGAWK